MSGLQDILSHKDRAVYDIRPEASAYQAVAEMCRRHIGALLVVEGGTPVGIISERDVLTRVILRQQSPEMTRVRDVMTIDVACVELDTEPEEAMAIMTARRCRHLPVLHGGEVVGILSIGDLVRWASEAKEFELRVLTEYVSGAYPG